MERRKDESYIAYVKRVTEAWQDGLISCDQWAGEVLGESIFATENNRRCAKFFSEFVSKLDLEDLTAIDADDKLAEIEEAKQDLIKERKKLQTVNAELQSSYRNTAKTELFQERIYEAIKELPPVNVKNITYTANTDTTALLALSDFHCGSDYVLYSPMIGGKQEVLNKYNFEIMQDRLWRLLAQIKDDDMVFSDLHIAFLGDFFENVLRLSSLAKIKEPVVDTVIRFSNFICTWIAEVHNQLEVPIVVTTVGGNHDEISYLQQGDRIKDENLAKIVVEFMKIRFADCKDIVIKPYSDASIETIRGVNVLFNHGEDKDLKTTLEYFSNTGMIECDEVITGHLHRPENKSVGISDVGDRQITRVGSICGVDAFSKRCRASARPSAYMGLYTEDGKTWSRNYYLG